MDINYEPLRSEVAVRDVDNFKRLYPINKKDSSVFVLILYFYFGVPVVLTLVLLFASKPVFLFAIIAFTVGFYSWSEFNRLRKHVRLHSFAKSNSMEYFPIINNSSHDGTIFNVGTRNVSYNVLSNNKFEIANFSCALKTGERNPINGNGYIIIQLNRKLPHVFLDSSANNSRILGISLSKSPISFKSHQRFSLEGNFDSYFTLYAKDEYKREVLEIFTPDLMDLFINELYMYDIEIVNDQLYIYSDKAFNLLDQTTLQKVFRIINIVGAKMVSQAKRYTDVIVDRVDSNKIIHDDSQLITKISINRILNYVFLVAILMILILALIQITGHSF